MSWQQLATHPWHAPLSVAQYFRGEGHMALLYSGVESAQSATSYLLLEPAAHATGERWEDLPAITDDTAALPDWVGYLGYEMSAPRAVAAASIALPGFCFTRYQRLFHFDHAAQRLTQWGRLHAKQPLEIQATATIAPPLTVRELASNMDRTGYERIVADTVRQIEDGQFYQANITRKFFGRLSETPDSFALFTRLCEHSPAPYSAYIKNGTQAILSASPECFLRISENGAITSRPIKGSIRRGTNEAGDSALRKSLQQSAKNLAENLMIVDLMRHDLSQVSEVGSVGVAEQSALHSFATIHHLISTVTAKKLPHANAYDVARACFPPGSMTGAPKKAAMDWCAKQEAMQRGVYSGAIGWFGPGDTTDLSVVIRTVLVDDDRFEFQVGGGIVAESTPEDEWRETLVKARGIARALGIAEADLEKL